jgi:hypothetical protein
MLKKTMVLTVVISALLALPAVSSAAEWQMEGSPLTGTTTYELTGTGQLIVPELGSFHCTTLHTKISMDPGNMGKDTEYKCTEPTGPIVLEEVFGCKVESVEAQDLPWNVTASASKTIIIEGIHIRYNMNAGCLVGPEIIAEDGASPVTLTPDNPSAIHSVTWGGELETNVGPAEAAGTSSATPAGTYGIG